MRKISILFLIISIILVLVACQTTPEPNPTIEAEPTEAPMVEEITEAPSEPEPSEAPVEPTQEPDEEPGFVLDAAPLPTVDEELAALDGLNFDDFIYESYRALLMRNPEYTVEYGLADEFGFTEPILTNISEAFISETERLETEIQTILQSYDREALTEDQQMTYDIYDYYLQALVDAQQYRSLAFPITFFILGSHSVQTELFLQDNHPMENEEDAMAYLYRLWQIEPKFDQAMETLLMQEEMGIIPSKLILNWTISDLKQQVRSKASMTPYYKVFKEKLVEISSLSVADRNDILEAAAEAVDDSVVPAYNEMIAYLETLLDKAPANGGLWQYDGGDAYYAYLLEKFTTTDLTADEIHQLGLTELARLHIEMREILTELGYPEDGDLGTLYEQMAQDGGSTGGPMLEDFYNQIIKEADARLPEAFDLLPEAKVVVVGGDKGAFYTPASLDGSRPGVFYANTTGGRWNYNTYSLTYHEAIPGHHLQLAMMQEMGLPLFRNIINFDSYAEGWALYAENLAMELGWYDDYLYGKLGKLEFEALRAARLVADTGIHSKGWTYDQAVTFLMENAMIPRGFAEYEAARYTVYPAQATSYMVGYLKFLELRQRVMDHQGEDFDLKIFHNVVLQDGAVPLDLLETMIVEFYGLEQ